MPDLFGSDFSLDVISKSLGADALNQTLISNNIANVDTPGYKRMEVSFKDQLKQVLGDSNTLQGAITNPRDIPFSASSLDQLEPTIQTDDNTTMRADGNNVDVDKEMAKLADNSSEYQSLSALAVAKFTMLRIAITGQ